MPDPVTPEPERPGSRPPAQVDLNAVRDAWDGQILSMVNDRNKRVAALARNAVVRDLDGEVLVLTFQYQVHASMVAKEVDVLATAIYEVFGVRWEVRCEVAGDQRPAASAQAASRPAPAQQAAPAQPRPAQQPAAPPKPAVTDEWPEPARPGGVAVAPKPVDAPVEKPVDAPVARAEERSGIAAARAAAAGRGGRTSAAPVRTADSTFAGEPPYDPEYDGPRPKAAYEGFDPGDEPTDDVVDERTARQSSEQQAVQLLQQTFGAEKIGEV